MFLKIKSKTNLLTVSVLLCVLGILIPAVLPLKVVLEPASYTLASHVPIFIALFISPMTAVVVAIGTTTGFFLGGFPLVVVLRAATQVFWAYFGATLIQNNGHMLDSKRGSLMFSLMLGLVHAACEMLVVMPFFFANRMAPGYYSNDFIVSVVFLVGLGTLLHSMVDYYVATLIWKPLRKMVDVPESDRLSA
jgi:niacin transporter